MPGPAQTNLCARRSHKSASRTPSAGPLPGGSLPTLLAPPRFPGGEAVHERRTNNLIVMAEADNNQTAIMSRSRPAHCGPDTQRRKDAARRREKRIANMCHISKDPQRLIFDGMGPLAPNLNIPAGLQAPERPVGNLHDGCWGAGPGPTRGGAVNNLGPKR